MKHYTITVNGVPYDVVVQEAATGQGAPAPAVQPALAANAAPVRQAPAPAAPAPTAQAPAAGERGNIVVAAPMPGNVLDIRVKAGQQVKAGEVVVVMEAMKMENEIVAPQDGTVASIDAAKGDVVNAGDVFLTLNG